MSPTISVVMPLYNSKEFLHDAIQSVLNQSYADFEFIIVDDSSDGSTDIAQRFEHQDQRVRVIKNDPPLGLRKSSNLALTEARGKYIARMESDDFSLPNRFRDQFEFMEQNPDVDILGGQMKLFGEEHSVWSYYQIDSEIKASMIWSIGTPHPCSFLRKSTTVDRGFRYDEDGLPYGEDWELFYRMGKSGCHFANLPNIIYKYRRGNESVTARLKEKGKSVHRTMLVTILKDLGLQVSDENLDTHQFVLGIFDRVPNPEMVSHARNWLEKIYRTNRDTQVYDENALRKVCEDRWEKLFYRLVPHGHSVVKSYFSNSEEVRSRHRIYYRKHRLKKLIGRA